MSFPSCLDSQFPSFPVEILPSAHCSRFILRMEGVPFSFIILGLAISGALLGAGFTEGTVYILDAMSLENESSEPFKYSKSSVSHVSFSHDSNYMATAVSSSLCSMLLPMDKGVRGLGKVGLYPSQAGVQRERERKGWQCRGTSVGGQKQGLRTFRLGFCSLGRMAGCCAPGSPSLAHLSSL